MTNFEFVECAECARKPGSPTLCMLCAQRRQMHGRVSVLEGQMERVLEIVSQINEAQEVRVIDSAGEAKEWIKASPHLRRIALRVVAAVALGSRADIESAAERLREVLGFESDAECLKVAAEADHVAKEIITRAEMQKCQRAPR